MNVEKDERFQKVQFAAWLGIIGNIVLTIIKGIVGWLAGSRALIADAVHSASDVVGSVAVLIGVRAAKLPPDKDHPYGHGKAESIAAIIVSVLLFIVGIEIALSAIKSVNKPIEVPGVIAIYAVILSIVVKELMFRYKYNLGKKYRSEAIITDAWHHRSDVFSSFAALIGIGASIVGGYIGVPWLVYADPLAGLFVSILILKMAWSLGKRSIHNTMDHVLHDEDTAEMRKTALAVKGVLSIDEFFAREHGHYVIIDLKIGVEPFITVLEGHAIGKNVKTELIKIDHVKDVRIHINPHLLEKSASDLVDSKKS